MASTVTRSQYNAIQSQYNRAPLGCGETGDSIRIMDLQPTNLQQLRDAIMSIWTKISKDCFQHLVASMPRRIKAVLKAKEVQSGTSKVYPIKWPVSVFQLDNKTQILRKNSTISSPRKVAVEVPLRLVPKEQLVSDLSFGSNVRQCHAVSFSCNQLEVVLWMLFISSVVVCEIFVVLSDFQRVGLKYLDRV